MRTLLIRGSTRVADIYVTEFDRVLRAFYFREVAAETAEDGRVKENSDEWLKPYFTKGAFKHRRRRMFFWRAAHTWQFGIR